MFFKIGVFKSFENFTGKHVCWSLFLLECQACNFIKKRFQHKYFLVNIVKFLSTALLIEHLRWLLLYLRNNYFGKNPEAYLGPYLTTTIELLRK